MNALLAIAGWLGWAALWSLAIYGGFKLIERLHASFETFAAKKLAEDALGYRPNGDCFPVIPECVEPFHRSGRNTL